MSRWQFSALDTWFFRESRPMESVGGSELQSTFPPSMRTVAGAIRHCVGQKHGVDWSTWNKPDSYPDVKAVIGDAASYRDLKFRGPWLVRTLDNGKRERLYPVPANVVAPRNKQGVQVPVRLTVGTPYRCDLGDAVRMPQVPAKVAEALAKQKKKLKSLDGYWVTAKTLDGLLAGDGCEPSELISPESLFCNETRLGIARNNLTRSVEEGMLYQTRHVRPLQQVSVNKVLTDQQLWVEVDVEGLSASDYSAEGVVRLGGEGRGAGYTVVSDQDDAKPLKTISDVSNANGVLLMLLTAVKRPEMSEKEYIPLAGFNPKQVETAEGTVWKGELEGVALTLHCAIQAKAIREGGWDLANRAPRDVQSLIPAGSVYYATVDDGNIQAAIEKIHLSLLPAESEDIALGRGLVAAGIWPKNEWVDKE